MSEPLARVRAISTARLPSVDTQAPLRAARSLGRTHLLEHREKLARRIARHERLYQQARIRGEQVDRACDCRAQALDGKALGRDAGTQRVAVRE